MISHEQNHKIIDETGPVSLFPSQPREWTETYMVLNYLWQLLFWKLIYVEDSRLWSAMKCRLANSYEDIFSF
jgi:hypothetical protein